MSLQQRSWRGPYIASHLEGEGKSQPKVAKSAEVTEVIVRNTYGAPKSSLKL